MENFALIIAYLFIGILLKWSGKIPKDFGNMLNLFVIYISLPALVLLNIPKLKPGEGFLFTILLPWAMLFFSAGAVIFLSRLFSWNRNITGCLLLMIPLGNTSFLGIPAVSALYGQEGPAYAIIYDQLGSFLALSTYGTLILALFSSDKAKNPTVKDVVMKIAAFPPFIALVVAGLMWGASYPLMVEKFLQNLGSTLVPLVMVAVGFQLSLELEEGAIAPLGAGLFIKLCLAPLFALFIAKIMGLKGLGIKVAITEAGMPPMVSAGALAILANLSPRLTAALVGFGIFFSFITLPVLKKILELAL